MPDGVLDYMSKIVAVLRVMLPYIERGNIKDNWQQFENELISTGTDQYIIDEVKKTVFA